MQNLLADKIVDDFERGWLSRRELIARLTGLGAAMTTMVSGAWAQEAGTAEAQTERSSASTAKDPTFEATGLDHIALDVVDVTRSRDFYIKHLGLRVIRGDENALFLGAERDFFLTLFRAERPQLDHYCYAIRNYDPDDAVQKLGDAGLRPRRAGGRVYFPDPDGLTVQVTGRR